jgi:hypothetical protein
MRTGHREHGHNQEYPSNSSEHRKTVGDAFIAVKAAPRVLIRIEFFHKDLSGERTNCSQLVRILIKTWMCQPHRSIHTSVPVGNLSNSGIKSSAAR